MRQILLKRNQNVRANPANPTELELLAQEPITLEDGVEPITLLGTLEPLAGTPKFRFSVPESLARQGVFLLGAYVESGVVSAYFSTIQGCGPISVQKGEPVLVVESSSQDALTLVDGDARFRGGVLMLDPQDTPTPTNKKKARRKKS